MYLEQQIASILQLLHALDARMESMERTLQRVVTDITDVKIGLDVEPNLKQEFNEFKGRWDSDSPDVQSLKASLEKLKSSLGGLTGMLTLPVDVVATEVETEVATEVTATLSEPQVIETTVKPAVKIVRVADQDESDAGIEMGKVTTTGLPPMWQGKTVGVKSVQESKDDGLPAVRFAIGDKIMDRK